MNGNGNEMLLALAARGAHHEIAQGANAIYAPFAGSWDVDVFDLEGDGARRVSRGEWHFGWVLEGRAMQDVFIAPPRGERANSTPAKGNRCATSLRIFDPATGLWRVYYFNPVAQTHETLSAKQMGKDIVQSGTDAKGASSREVFCDISPASFRWHRETADNPGTWKLRSEYSARRRG